MLFRQPQRLALLLALLALAIATLPVKAEGSGNVVDYAAYVDPFIGTAGTGHTFPGAAYPLGLVQPSPDTNNHSWDHTSGYQYHDQSIMGFSHNHLSGTGISDLGDVLIQPFTGDASANGYRSRFDHDNEEASPGYYSVLLTDFAIKAELTASEHVAMHRYTYPPRQAPKLLMDFQHGIVNAWIPLDEHVLHSDVVVEDDRTISGFIESTSWVRHKTFFVIRLSAPASDIQRLDPRGRERAPRLIASFAALDKDQLQIKVALSTVSVAGAKANMDAQVAGWDFEAVALKARNAWNSYLSRIDIDAPPEQKTIFYTALYHLFLQPNNTADVDGRYRAFDDSIREAITGRHYSTFSLWDTFRAAHPLYTIIAPELVDDFVNSLLAQQELQGFLPIWGLMNKETFTMIGNHAVPVVVDAVLKGIDGIDRNRAYQAVRETLTNGHKNSDWSLYEKYGYYPFDLLDADGESVSRTLESTYDDAAAARLAKQLGREADYRRFKRRSGFYENLFDESTGFMRGRDAIGNWRKSFDPLVATSPMNNPGDYTEANAYQYLWAAQHATEGMIRLFGSKAAFVAKLDEFFSKNTPNSDVHLGQEAMIGQYAHGNEPSHHIAYLYQFASRHDRTRSLVTQIYEDFYSARPDGIQGNEDCGQMSAWYIFTTLGFYPVDPSSGRYVFGLAQVQRATVNPGTPREFTITRRTPAGEVKGDGVVSLNGSSVRKYWLEHSDLVAGGVLRFE